MCFPLLLVVGLTLLSEANAAESIVEDGNLPVVFVGLLAFATIMLLVILCAGDTKVSKVEHNEKDNIQRISASKKTSSQYNRQAFEEVEFSRPNKDHSKESQSLIQKHGDWSSHNRNVPDQLNTKSQLSEENVIVINQDEEITNGNQKVNMVCDNNRASTSNNTQNVHVVNITSDTIDNNEPSNSGVNNNTAISRHPIDRQMTDSSHSNYNRQNTNSTNNNNRQDHEDTCDDFGYHSDYSKSIKPDTDSNLLSTFRSSHLQSNGTNARSLTSYDIYDDAIETYNDDGESIDWN